jgi:hypothetical protein
VLEKPRIDGSIIRSHAATAVATNVPTAHVPKQIPRFTRLSILSFHASARHCLSSLIARKKRTPCFFGNGRSFAEFAYTTWNASLRNPVNSPPTFRSRLAGAPGEDGLFTFRGCLPESVRVRDFYFWRAGRDLRVSFGAQLFLLRTESCRRVGVGAGDFLKCWPTLPAKRVSHRTRFDSLRGSRVPLFD